MYKLIISTFYCLFIAVPTITAQNNLIIYEAPGGYKYSAHNDDYTVKVRQKGTVEWKDLFEYSVEVDLDTRSKASMVTFDFEGTVELMIQKNNGMFREVAARPLALGIHPKADQNAVTLELNKPCNISLEFDRDRLHNLHIFANPIIKNIPNKNDKNVMYFGPGIHKPGDQPGDVFHIPSNTTVYIDGGAILEGKLLIDKQKNITILGHGISMLQERGVEIRYSDNITVDGLIFVNPKHYTIYGGQSNNLTIKNIKSFSSNGWSDGIDLMSCSDVLIDKVFMRNSDDCIAIYGHRWDFYGNAQNYQITNSVLWADVAHPTNIGLHGDAEKGGDTIAHIKFKNIDILEHDEDDRNYQGCLAITCGDNNYVTDVSYEDIRIESVQEGMLFNFRAVYNEKYSLAPGNTVSNISLKNIQYTGTLLNPSILQGHSTERMVSGVTIENLIINTKKITEPEPEYIQAGSFTVPLKWIKK